MTSGRHILPKKTASRLVALSTLLALSGCIRARVTLDVRADGSGTLASSVGLSDEAQQMLTTSSPDDPLDVVARLVFADQPNVQVEHFTQDEYDWVRGTNTFADQDQLDALVASSEFFESFDLIHRHNFLRSRYELTARVRPLLDAEPPPELGTPSQEELDALEEILDIEVWIRMPGQVVESNADDEATSGALIWQTTGQSPTDIHMVTQEWHWRTIARVISVTLVILVVIDTVLRALRNRRRARESDQLEGQ